MLARVARSAATVRVARQARAFCAVTDPDEIVKGIEDAIVEAKAAIASPPELPYTLAALQADAEKGTVNTMKLGEIFSFDPEIKKMVLQAASSINGAANAKPAKGINWDAWDAKFTAAGQPGVIGSLRSEFEPIFMELQKEVDSRIEETLAEKRAELNAEFNGAGGLIADAKKHDAQEAEAKKAAVLHLEDMLYQAQNAENLTVAEMLEKNPDWREAIEEDIKNHNWSPEAPASLVEAMKAKQAESAAGDAKKIES